MAKTPWTTLHIVLPSIAQRLAKNSTCNFSRTERLPVYRGSLCKCSNLLEKKRKEQLACDNLNLQRVQFLHLKKLNHGINNFRTLKLSEKLDLNDNGLDALIAQFSNDMQLNEDLESSNEQEVQEQEEDIDIDNEEVQVQAEEEDVDDKDEEVQDEEEEFPEDTPQTTSSVTTCNVTNLEPRVDLARLPDLGIISPPQSSDEQEEEEEQDSSDDDDSIKLTVSKEEAIKFVKNNFGVIPYK